MFLKKITNSLTNDKFLLFIIFFISFLLNKYYANLGVFPIDTFFHFDTGFRVLNGEYPVKDFWVVSGILVDYLEAFFFYILGVSWKTHVFHSSFINGIITLATFFVLRSFQFNKFFSFLYSFFFCVLAYPPSGTPFLDHHAAFFSLLGIYSFILALKKNKNFYWILMPIFIGLSFFSKQVPSGYLVLPLGLITVFYSIVKKDLNPIIYAFVGSLVFVFIVILIGAIQEISLNEFLIQYIYYPPTFGGNRLNNFSFTFNSVIVQYKFIYFALVPLIFLNIYNLIINKNYIKEKKFFIFLVILFYSLSLIFHQMLTKNQIFIYFLCPLLLAFLKIYLSEDIVKFKTVSFLTILAFAFFVTGKYHLRFNEGRKFHELSNTNLNLSKKASLIDKKFSGLKWITPNFKDNPQIEINFLNETLKILLEDGQKKMVLTNYLFFSTLMNENLYAPSRSQTVDGMSFPMRGNKYYSEYKNYFLNIIKSNKIKVIYVISSDYTVLDRLVYDYFDKSCINEHNINKRFKKFEINKC